MKLLKFQHANRVAFGALEEGDNIRVLKGSPFENPIETTPETIALNDVTLLPPTVEHPRIFGIGFNYKSHIQETGKAIPELPSVFMKPDTALLAHNGEIVYPKVAELVHYETELVAVISKRARAVSRENALDYVLGYTCGNDVSERTFQRKEMAMGLMTVGKAFDTFAPVGPWVATDLDPTAMTVQGRLNGALVQECHTSDLLFGVDALVEYLSTFITLMPGDLIMTGTAGGVGSLKPGDQFDVEIQGVGTLSNRVVMEA